MSNSPDGDNKTLSEELFFNEFASISREEWEAAIAKDLEGADYIKKNRWKAEDDLDLLPFYMAEETESLQFARRDPGRFPYSRGFTAEERGWKICQPVTETEIEKAGKQAQKAIENGCDSLLINYKILHPNDQAERSLTGLNLQDQACFHHFAQNFDLTKTHLLFDCGPLAPFLLAGLHNELERNNLPGSSVNIDLLYDPLTFQAFHGQPVKRNGKWVDDMVEMLHLTRESELPFRTIGIDARAYQNSGANTVQELAFGLSLANEYLVHITNQSIPVEVALKQLFFAFGTGSSYFKEIAKLRAARLLWSHIVAEYGLEKNKNPVVPIYSFTSEWNKTLYDSYHNLLRAATESMSATMGGCDLLVTCPFDGTLRPADTFSCRLARNQQLILKEEAYFDKVKDPAGGSYYVEMITKKIAEKAWDLFLEIENRGGFEKALSGGFIRHKVEKSRRTQMRKMAERKRVMVGINNFPDPEEEVLKELEQSQVVNPIYYTGNKIQKSGNGKTSAVSLLSRALNNGSALGDALPLLMDDAKKQLDVISSGRVAEEFEQLRLATEKYKKEGGKRPKVFLMPMGTPKTSAARATFSADIFGLAGYYIHSVAPFDTVESAVGQLVDREADITVICSSDSEYPDLCPKIAEAVKEHNIKTKLVLAGAPGDNEEFFNSLGIRFFVYKGMNVLAFLKKIQKEIGIIS